MQYLLELNRCWLSFAALAAHVRAPLGELAMREPDWDARPFLGTLKSCLQSATAFKFVRR